MGIHPEACIFKVFFTEMNLYCPNNLDSSVITIKVYNPRLLFAIKILLIFKNIFIDANSPENANISILDYQ